MSKASKTTVSISTETSKKLDELIGMDFNGVRSTTKAQLIEVMVAMISSQGKCNLGYVHTKAIEYNKTVEPSDRIYINTGVLQLSKKGKEAIGKYLAANKMELLEYHVSIGLKGKGRNKSLELFKKFLNK